MKKTAILTLSFLFLLGMSSYAQADHKHRGDNHKGYDNHRSMTHSGNYRSNKSHSHSYDHQDRRHHNHYRHTKNSHQGYRSHHRHNHVYVEKHVYNYGAPRVTHRHNHQPTYYPPRRSHSTYKHSYNRGVVGDTLIGGAFGAATGTAIGAALGNPGQGAAIGAAVGGFNGISREIFGRGFLW